MIETQMPTTFQQLLADHERIRIPRLQRDYAQGRTSAQETEVRECFLEVLREALERKVDSGFAPLNLDFIYGSEETVPHRHFSPLDGQQRLTTLFLLHWLLAWRDGDDCWKRFTDSFCEADARARFSYRVRTSSKEFFDELVGHRPSVAEAKKEDFSLKDWIIDQSWYYRYWRLDPTVQGVLEVLQAMHKLFRDRPAGLYARLTDKERPAITFQVLNLGADFPLSDDLYIKMNARGKALTTFETLKARYEQNLPAHFAAEVLRDIGGVPFPMAEFVARRLDTAWTDFLWEHHKQKPDFAKNLQRLDESFMNIFRVVALVSRDPDKDSYRSDIKLLRDGENSPTYSAFDTHQWLDAEFSALLVRLMEYWCDSGIILAADCPFNEHVIFCQILENPAKLTVPQVLLFCGYALFVQEHEGRPTPAQFAAWMRVVHNLGVNSDIDDNERLQSPVKGLRGILPHSVDILKRVADFGVHGRVLGFSDQQQREEALKASLLLADPTGWAELIYRAEGHGYFRGQIDFLFAFSGTREEWLKTGNCSWAPATHRRFQQSFREYLEKAEAMFDTNGLTEIGEARWQRALLSIGNYLLPYSWTNMSFLVNDVSKAYSWKRLLRDNNDKRCFVQQLWDRLNLELPLSAQLDAIIGASSGLEPWQEALVRNADAVLFCERHNIQREGNHVVLLKRERRSAPHAELFTFLLHRVLQPPAPFILGDYFFRDAPYFPLYFTWGEEEVSLDIYGRDGEFDLWVKLPLVPELHTLLTSSSFVPTEEFPDWLVLPVTRADIEPTLRQLGALLTTS